MYMDQVRPSSRRHTVCAYDKLPQFWSYNRGRRSWISWDVLPLIKTLFCLAPFPERSWTSCPRTPKYCARNWHNSVLAWPSTGGAARRTLRASPCKPTISVWAARGWQWIRSSTFPDRSCMQDLIWLKTPPPYHLKRCFISNNEKEPKHRRRNHLQLHSKHNKSLIFNYLYKYHLLLTGQGLHSKLI